MAGFALFVIFGLAVAYANALTFGRFEKISDGVWNDWNETNPDNVIQGRFGMRYGNDRLWLISRRLYRKGFVDPWDPAARGGIVSTFRISTRNWTHQSYDRLDEDTHGDKLFSLHGRLFMLTYSTGQRKIGFHKLFFWDDQSGRWLETPFEFDPTSTTVSALEIAQLTVTVPNQDGKLAYVVASTHRHATTGKEIVYSKLDVEFRGNVPVKATLKSLAREESGDPSAVFYTAVHENKLYAFIMTFWSEGYEPITNFAYTLDLTTNRIGNVSLGGPSPSADFEEERMYQKGNEIFMAGGTATFGLGQLRDVKEIWSLDLSTLQWRNTNSTLPTNAGDTTAFDQQGGKLYLAGLKEGVRVAEISS